MQIQLPLTMVVENSREPIMNYSNLAVRIFCHLPIACFNNLTTSSPSTPEHLNPWGTKNMNSSEQIFRSYIVITDLRPNDFLWLHRMSYTPSRLFMKKQGRQFDHRSGELHLNDIVGWSLTYEIKLHIIKMQFSAPMVEFLTLFFHE